VSKSELTTWNLKQFIRYKGESNENLKNLNIFISQFIEHKRHTMTSFFYVVSIAFHTSVSALRKCMNTSRKKLFSLTARPLVHQVEESPLQN